MEQLRGASELPPKYCCSSKLGRVVNDVQTGYIKMAHMIVSVCHLFLLSDRMQFCLVGTSLFADSRSSEQTSRKSLSHANT